MSRNLFKKYKAGERTDEILNAVKHAEELAAINLEKVKIKSNRINLYGR